MSCLNSHVKDILKNLTALFIGLSVVFVVAEVILRLFPKATFPMGSISCEKDMDVGYKFTPNQESFYRTSCFNIYPIRTNSLGFRDNVWDQGRGFKIAVLGDSLMHAREVSEGDHTSAVLEKLLNVEVMNTGVSGYGTVTESLVYKKFLSPLKPEIVILFFTPGNDVANNHCGLTRMTETKTLYQACGNVVNDEVKIDYSFRYNDSGPPKKSFIKNFLKSYCVSCVSINEWIKRYVSGISYDLTLPVFTPPKSREWQEAWKITEKTLVDLNNEVKANNGKLIIVPFPDYMMISRNWRDEIREHRGLKEIPKDFDPFYPANRLQGFAQINGIDLLRLDPEFLFYRDKFNLPPPYFSYWCDGHPNPVGHFLASNMVAGYLISNRLVPVSDEEAKVLLGRIEKNISLSPKEILGNEAHSQVYNNGVYRGSSNIGGLLN